MIRERSAMARVRADPPALVKSISPPYREAAKIMSDKYFYVAAAVFMLPGAYVVYGLRGTPSEQIEALIWNLAPVLVAIGLFKTRSKGAAWGWLIGTGVTMYVVVIAVMNSARPTSSIALFWAPIWNILIVGPVGAIWGRLIRRVGK